MKILLVSPHFYPENFKCNDVAFDLVKRGHQVTVLSDIPNYPIGHFFKGYGILKKRFEKVFGVDIIRVLVIPRGNGNGFRLILNYLSFLFFGSIYALFLAFFKHFDAIIVHETSPITVGIPALIVKKIQRIPLYFWVLDLWPESLRAAGGIQQPYILGFFSWIAKILYKNSRKILISSKGFRKSILEKGNYSEKIIYFPNWAEDVFSSTLDDTSMLPCLPNGFKVMFAGNLGEAQDLEHVMEAALSLKEENIHFIIIGDGRKRKWVESFVKNHQLSKTVHLLGRYPLEDMPAFFKQADLMLISLKDDLIFNLTVPAKLQAYMAAGKPVIGMINGEAQNIINESECGMVCSAGDSMSLAENIRKLHLLDTQTISRMGTNAFLYYQKYFKKDNCLNNLAAILEDD